MAAAIAIALLLTATASYADETEDPVEVREYTASVVGVDALAVGAIALIATDAVNDDVATATAIAGAAIYVFGPAVVHVQHDNSSSAWKSVALRLGLPAVGFAAGFAAAGPVKGDGDGVDDADRMVPFLMGVAGAGIGTIVAIGFDWVGLAKVKVPARPGSTAMRPFAAPIAGGGASVGIAGTFR